MASSNRDHCLKLQENIHSLISHINKHQTLRKAHIKQKEILGKLSKHPVMIRPVQKEYEEEAGELAAEYQQKLKSLKEKYLLKSSKQQVREVESQGFYKERWGYWSSEEEED
jgi:hypothetical protein